MGDAFGAVVALILAWVAIAAALRTWFWAWRSL